MEKILSFSSFSEKLVAELTSSLGDDFEIQGPNEITKNNGEVLTGIIFQSRADDSGLGKTIYLEDVFDSYLKGETIHECVKDIEVMIRAEAPDEIKHIKDLIRDQDFIRAHLGIKVISYEANSDLLKNSVYRRIEDLAAVAILKLGYNGDVYGTIRVTPELLEAWQLTKDEVLSMALENNDRIDYSIRRIDEMLVELAAPLEISEFETFPDDDCPMYVITSQERLFGAAILASPRKLDALCRTLGEPCYILPSSIEEIIAVRRSAGVSLEDLRQMVRNVNEECVSTTEYLSSEVYEIDPVTKKLTIADSQKIESETISQQKSIRI